MTSTGFNIGLNTEKNSSRVLKPPGGGHSDIFGIRDNDNGIVTPSKKRNQPQSTIGSCFKMVEDKMENESQQDNKETSNGVETNNGVESKNEEVNEVDNGIDENKAPSEPEEKAEEKKEVQTPGPQRVRVPPGGFSSGLW